MFIEAPGHGYFNTRDIYFISVIEHAVVTPPLGQTEMVHYYSFEISFRTVAKPVRISTHREIAGNSYGAAMTQRDLEVLHGQIVAHLKAGT